MRKVYVVAIREYLAAVKTKSFIVSLILLPIMMGGGVIAQKVGQKIGDTSTKRIALLDRSPEAMLTPAIMQAVKRHNSTEVEDESGRQVRAKFAVESISPAPLSDPAAVDRQRLELSDQVRSGALLAFVEIGPQILRPAAHPDDAEEAGDSGEIRYTTNRPTYRDFVTLLQAAAPATVFEKRLADAGMSYQGLRPLLVPPRIVDRGMAEQHPDGSIGYEPRSGQLAPFLVPVVLLVLMFIVVIVGASPMTGNVIEEKQLRIAEVLLGSVSPFELMMGKLFGGVAVALTLATIYFGGAYYVAFTQGMAGYVTGGTIGWFLFFTILGTMMYGSMFVAAGAAVTTIKEAQTIIMPVMLLIVLPVSLVGNMIQDPSGVLATAASFFPFSAPMVMTARIAIPPGVPLWQKLTSAGVTVISTVVLVWLAGRVFRVGILLQGQAASYAKMALDHSGLNGAAIAYNLW